MTRLLFGIALVALATTPALAQKRCVKGIPCGNTCIAANKTCRIGSPAPAPTPTLATAAGDTIADSVKKLVDYTGSWVASKRGNTYYKAGCRGARDLAPLNLIAFKTEEDAKKAGYKRSTQRGC